jgi:polyisoprenoid-binding protein YceI
MNRLVPLMMSTLAWASIAAAQPQVVVQPGAGLAIDGTSTVRDFTCEARVVKAQLTPGETGDALAPEQMAGALSAAVVEFPVARLDCANGTMNEHMLKALLAEQHPTIRFELSGYEAGAVKDGQVPLRIHGGLTLAGVTRPIDLEARATPGTDGTLRVRGRYLLRMTDWSVRPPTLMLGTLKVGDSVVIRFDLTLQRQ